MLRRWYVVLVCLALTAAGAYATSRAVHETYESTATVVLLPPSSVVTESGNPYLFMGGLDQALSVLAVKLNSVEVAGTLTESGGSFAVEKDPRGPGPLITITAEAASGPGSEELRDAILDRLPNDLRDLQAELGVAADSQIGAMTVVQSSRPTKVVKEQMRAMLAVSAAGIGLTMWVTGMVDRWMLARAARRRDKIDQEDREDVGTEHPNAVDRRLFEDSAAEFVSSGQT